MKIYLAGKMGGRMGHEVLEERYLAAKACDDAGLEYYDPAEGENIAANEPVDLRMDFETMRRFVTKDDFAIANCDALLILTGDTPSEGVGLEFGFAKGAFGSGLNLPVIVVSPRRASGELMGFWNVKADAVFSTVEEAAEWIAIELGGR